MCVYLSYIGRKKYMKKYILAYHTFILIKVSSRKLGLLEVYYIKKVVFIV